MFTRAASDMSSSSFISQFQIVEPPSEVGRSGETPSFVRVSAAYNDTNITLRLRGILVVKRPQDVGDRVGK